MQPTTTSTLGESTLWPESALADVPATGALPGDRWFTQAAMAVIGVALLSVLVI